MLRPKSGLMVASLLGFGLLGTGIFCRLGTADIVYGKGPGIQVTIGGGSPRYVSKGGSIGLAITLYRDQDKRWDTATNQVTFVDDALRDAVWGCTPQYGYCSPTSGSGTTYHAPEYAATVAVSATGNDVPSYADDSPAEASVTVYVLDATISPSGEIVQCVGQNVALQSAWSPVIPPGATSYQWSKVSGPGAVTFGASTAQSTTVTADTPGRYTVKVAYTWSGGTVETQSGDIWFVGVGGLQYKVDSDSQFQAAPVPPDRIVVGLTSTVYLKAIKAPSDAPSWPSGKPIWEGAGAAGEYAAKICNVASSSPTNPAIVTAECGNTVSVRILVVDLGQFSIKANRTSPPSETSYPMKDDEHFEVGGTFDHEIFLDTWPEPYRLFYEIWDLDWLDERVASGPGKELAGYTWPSGILEGNCGLKWFVDKDLDQTSDSGENAKNSPDFYVATRTDHALEFAQSSTISSSINPSPVVADATARILKKDSADDYRATAQITQSGSVATIQAQGHDPVDVELAGQPGSYEVLDTWANVQYFKDNAGDATVVVSSDIRPCDHNGNPLPGGDDIAGFSGVPIMIQLPDFAGNTLAHEVGHNCGLGDLSDAQEQDRIMYYANSGSCTLLAITEVAAYE